MKKIIIIIAIIVLILIIIFVHDRKSINQGFTGTIYTINYCDEKDHCDEMITIGKKFTYYRGYKYLFRIRRRFKTYR